MNRIKKFFIAVLATVLIVVLCAGSAMSAFADTDGSVADGTELSGEPLPDEEGNAPADETQAPDEAETAGLKDVAAKFTQYLKDEYGEDYEYYYNQIIENWGSVEAYLLAFGGKLPDEYKSDWDKFVGWLSEYSVIWAPVLAVAIVIDVALIGKKQFEKIVEKIVIKVINPIVKELNLQSKAQVASLRGQKALLGNNPKFMETVTDLEISERELKGDE